MTIRTLLLATCCLALPFSACAQKKSKDTLSGYDHSAKATILHDAVVYVGPDPSTQKLTEILPGHEMVIVEHNGPWLKVFTNTDGPDKQDDDSEPLFNQDGPEPDSGWIKDKGVITPGMPGGDILLFGSAAGYEDQASRPHAPKDAPTEARLLYKRVYEYFPDSPLAADAMYRSADIRWQLDKASNADLPSAKEQEAWLRPQIYEGELKRVIKLYPRSNAAMLASYDLIDNKLCGDWQGLPKCPEMETGLYLKYAAQFPESPKAPEAFYNAVFRQAVLVTMYQVDDNRKRVEKAAADTQSLAADMLTRFPNSDWTRRAQSIAFRVKQDIPIYGSDRD